MDLDAQPDAGTATEPPRRRRGAELEQALLEAAWQELTEHGYGALTMESVAERAGTSRTVLYRRWSSRAELAVAAVRRRYDREPAEVPDTGSLRGDMIALLMARNERRGELIGFASVLLADYFLETHSTPADLRESLIGGRRSGVDTVLQRADERGEIELSRVPQRVRTVAFDLFRHEVLMTLRPVSEEFIVSVVDDVFLPLASRSRAD